MNGFVEFAKIAFRVVAKLNPPSQVLPKVGKAGSIAYVLVARSRNLGILPVFEVRLKGVADEFVLRFVAGMRKGFKLLIDVVGDLDGGHGTYLAGM